MARAFFAQDPEFGGEEANTNQNKDDEDLLDDDEGALKDHAGSRFCGLVVFICFLCAVMKLPTRTSANHNIF